MSACPPTERLRQFLADQLNGPDEGTLAAHVERCVSCQGQLETLTQEAGRFARHATRAPRAEADTPPTLLERLRRLPAAGVRARDTHSDSLTLTQPDAAMHAPGAPLVVPGYEVLDELGRGGMGVVYRARQLGFNRVVALKMLLDGPHAGAEQRARFRREAEAVARLHHPNIVQVFDVGEHDGRPFFSMEYVAGGSLAACTRDTPQEPGSAAELVVTLAAAVQAAHAAGVVHRDLKPTNILLAGGERGPIGPIGPMGPIGPLSPLTTHQPKITDFGLAKHLPAPGDADADGMTHSGTILGSPSYMAPEQAAGQGQDAGPEADVYALGAVLYELLTGRPPFKGATPLDTLLQVRHEEPVAPRQLVPAVPRDLETICLKCLEKTPARRYESAAALADDLRRFLAGEPVLARPAPAWERAAKWARRRPAVAALLLVAALAFAGVALAWQRAAKQRTLALENLQRAVDVTIDQLVLVAKLTANTHPDGAYHRQQTVHSAAQFFEKVLAEDQPADERSRRLRGRVLHGLGLTYRVAGDYTRAEQEYRRAEALQKALVTDYAEQLDYQVDLALTYQGLGEVYHLAGNAADGKAAYGKAVELFAAVRPDHPRLALHVALLAQELFNRGKLHEAVPWQDRLLEQLEAREKEATTPEQRARLRAVRVSTHATRALSLIYLRQFAEALADWDRAAELEPTQPPVMWRVWRARTLALSGQHAAAAEALKEFTDQGWLTGPALAAPGLGGTLAEVASSTYAECRMAALQDDKLPTAERERRADDYAARLVALLGRARDAGLFKEAKYRDQLRKDPRLAFLHEREDYQALLKSLGDE